MKVYVYQRRYADLLTSAHLSNCRSTDTPLELNVKLQQTDGSPVSCPSTYRRLVGSLLYLTMTRPNISHAVQIISQFVSNPYTTHLAAVQCILQYLCGTPVMDYSTLYDLHLLFKHMQPLFGHGVQILDNQPPGGICS